jgi:hypothetical protein
MYYIQTSTDGGKSFDTVKKTPSRTKAFDAYVEVSATERARLFKDNTLIVVNHLEDAVN